ncbi:DUF6680 family protein [Methyloraptor flagellatus]|uniref:DUF6680 family protein n=1 Tax=Methyloraptor flagellatus TaxID=3162530 RepID=A0AAU7XGQ9_9HYPH
MTSNFYDFQLKDLINLAILLVTIFAVYFGPIRAVQVAKENEKRDRLIGQRADLFAVLMKTRAFRLGQEHVNALNLVLVYFRDCANVLVAYRAYISMFNAERINFTQERDDKFIELLAAMASELGYNAEKRDIEQLGYSPQVWFDDENNTRRLRNLFIELLENKRGLSVINFLLSGSGSGPFPPTPKQ